MNKLLLRLLINALALYVAARVVPGIQLGDNVAVILGVALVFGLVKCHHPALARTAHLPVHHPDVGAAHACHQRVDAVAHVAFSRAVGLTFVVRGFLACVLGRIGCEHRQPGRDVIDSKKTIDFFSVSMKDTMGYSDTRVLHAVLSQGVQTVHLSSST